MDRTCVKEGVAELQCELTRQDPRDKSRCTLRLEGRPPLRARTGFSAEVSEDA